MTAHGWGSVLCVFSLMQCFNLSRISIIHCRENSGRQQSAVSAGPLFTDHFSICLYAASKALDSNLFLFFISTKHKRQVWVGSNFFSSRRLESLASARKIKGFCNWICCTKSFFTIKNIKSYQNKVWQPRKNLNNPSPQLCLHPKSHSNKSACNL